MCKRSQSPWTRKAKERETRRGSLLHGFKRLPDIASIWVYTGAEILEEFLLRETFASNTTHAHVHIHMYVHTIYICVCMSSTRDSMHVNVDMFEYIWCMLKSLVKDCILYVGESL
jgi:hypothetical protein